MRTTLLSICAGFVVVSGGTLLTQVTHIYGISVGVWETVFLASLLALPVIAYGDKVVIFVWNKYIKRKEFRGTAQSLTLHIELSKPTGRTTPPPWSVRIKNWFRRIGS